MVYKTTANNIEAAMPPYQMSIVQGHRKHLSADEISGVVYIVDDHEAMLRMLSELLSGVGLHAKTYTSAWDFLNGYRPGPCECLISDVRMPELGGLGFQRLLRDRGYTLPVIFITGYAEIGTAVEAMKGGAFDFIQKGGTDDEIIDKVARALERSRTLYAEALELKAEEARLSLLTPSEQRVLRLLAQGNSSKEIAAELALSPRTVDNHRGRIMEKLHVNSSVELVLLFMRWQSRGFQSGNPVQTPPPARPPL